MNEFTYFSLKVKRKASPVRIKFKTDGPFTSFKLIVSREVPSPSQFNCDYNLIGNIFSFESLSNPLIFDH